MSEIETEFMEILGPVADPSNISLNTIEQSLSKLFEVLLKHSEPKSDIAYGIALGLLVKAKKLFDSIQNVLSKGDMLAFSILARSLYETSISLRYFLTYAEKEDTARLYIIGDAMTQKYQLKQKFKNEKITKEECEKGVQDIIRRLSAQGIDQKELLGNSPPKSWHPTKNYRKLAADLDETGEALEIYDSLYTAMSKDAHPSMHDIMRWHVTQRDESAPFIPNLHSRYSSNIEVTLVACMMYAMFETYAKYTKGCGGYVELVSAFHIALHKSFNSTKPPIVESINSFQRYASFWLQNYPNEQQLPTD